jgi:uncharacterized repeat protein (TIGR03803 family)
MRSIGNLVAAFLTATALGACGGSNSFSSSTPMSVVPQIAAPRSGTGSAPHRLERLLARQPRTAAKYKSLYSFKGGKDGATPEASLIAVGSELYGTTEYAGGADASGTVFEMSMSGNESVLHGFEGTAGGTLPKFSESADDLRIFLRLRAGLCSRRSPARADDLASVSLAQSRSL